MMFIVPVSQLSSIVPSDEKASISGTSAGSGFEHILKNAMQHLEETQRVSEKDSIDLALGNSDDLHSIQINTMKATAAIELTTSVTSKVLSAYREIISMQL